MPRLLLCLVQASPKWRMTLPVCWQQHKEFSALLACCLVDMQAPPASGAKVPTPSAPSAQTTPEQPQQMAPTAPTAPGTPPAAAMAEGPSTPAAAAVATLQPEAPTTPAVTSAPAVTAPETEPTGAGAPPAGSEIVPEESITSSPAAPAAGEAAVAMPATPGRAPSPYYTAPPSPLPGAATPVEPYSSAGSVTSTESKVRQAGNIHYEYSVGHLSEGNVPLGSPG